MYPRVIVLYMIGIEMEEIMAHWPKGREKQEPEAHKWFWYTEMKRPVYLLDTVKIMNKPVIACPTFDFEDDGGIREDYSVMIVMVVEWNDLRPIDVRLQNLKPPNPVKEST